MNASTSEGTQSAQRILREVPETTARFHRSTREAFPAERFAAIEVFRPRPAPLGWRVSGWTCWACVVFLIAIEIAERLA